jgi:hydrogenase-4 membrane subunit HyfE
MQPSLFMQPSQVAKLINANVSMAALFAVVFLHYLPADIWRILTTPFDEMPGED